MTTENPQIETTLAQIESTLAVLGERMLSNREVLEKTIRYGDNKSHALIELTQERQLALRAELDGLRSEVDHIKQLREKNEEEEDRWHGVLLLQIVGWVIVVIIAVVGFLMK